jgi:hypothetical protein
VTALRPVVYLTSVAAVVAAKSGRARPDVAACVGPGLPHGIMRWPHRARMPPWAFDRRALALTPPANYLANFKRFGDFEGYALALRDLWLSDAWMRDVGTCRPGGGLELYATDEWPRGRQWDGETVRHVGAVGDGDTLCCACSVETGRAWRCHRVVAADLLRLSGWRVVLDGVDLDAPATAGAAQTRLEW